ncbi:uncharacterized protein LOC106637420 [Copidosoma floridanum]|uniref:uncharacterized protein LOC106637420 n=1 Tax=Copidosoma floridanum TaxID=29053 RepID=UPI0006C9BF93|nr:uncharacterized protein LOC106637420 [Copidosoma floridanum]
MNFRDPSVLRWLFKSSSTGDHNEAKQRLPLDKKESKKPITPARKRSSLARPVRVHDACLQDHGPFVVNWNEDKNLQNQQQQQEQQLQCTDDEIREENSEKDKKSYEKRLNQGIDDLVEICVDEEVTTWPIRLRLGEFFELTLPKCHRRKRRRRHLMMIATMREKTMKSMMEAGGIRASRKKGAFKDTERLLKVLSINNVDQDSRYNVARCIVM